MKTEMVGVNPTFHTMRRPKCLADRVRMSSQAKAVENSPSLVCPVRLHRITSRLPTSIGTALIIMQFFNISSMIMPKPRDLSGRKISPRWTIGPKGAIPDPHVIPETSPPFAKGPPNVCMHLTPNKSKTMPDRTIMRRIRGNKSTTNIETILAHSKLRP